MHDKLSCYNRCFKVILIDSLNLDFFSFGDLYESKIALKISKSNGWLLFDGSNGKVSLVELFIWEGFGDEGFQFEE